MMPTSGSVATRLVAVLTMTLPLAARAAPAPTPTLARPAPQRPASARGTVVVPDHFLRRWDPVTIFFATARGPARGGPEDRAERFVTCTPPHPGAFTWLDARTLQFRPAEPWPPLARFTWKAGGTTARLTTLMAAPTATVPADGALGLDTVEAVTLTFAEPVDPQALSRMVNIELQPLPGVGSGGGRWLTRADFDIKAMERHARAESATYVVELKSPIPLGTRVTVHLRLSLDDDAAESFAESRFATAAPFRVIEAGCRAASDGGEPLRRTYPITPDGSRYNADQALDCGTGDRTLLVEFSARPGALGPVEARTLFRLTPPVENLASRVEGNTLIFTGDFASDTVYGVTLTPAPLSDAQGRPLDLRAESQLFVYFPRRPAFLRWDAARGVLERFGPHMLPVRGRGNERVDLRIVPVDPLDRSFWPFPASPVVVDESQQPPPPGEEPPVHGGVAPPSIGELQRQIAALGSPLVSAIVPLPLKRDGRAATFGLDVRADLARISGPNKPGTYLVGLRRLDTSSERTWARVQVTDLSLTTVEEPRAVRFVVTSLSSGRPLRGATVLLQGAEDAAWRTLGAGSTDADGSFVWPAPGFDKLHGRAVRRIVVRHGDDVLVLDPDHAPDGYHDNHWALTHERWLQWAFEELAQRGPQPEDLCHIFTDRPVYRPEDEVHIKGYLRRRAHGALAPLAFDGFVVVDGPGGQTWRLPVTLTPDGSFYHSFSDANLPTGEYSAHLEDAQKHSYGAVTFRKEAYRVPTFEVQLHAADRVPLDREFSVQLTARYYAGGKVARRPVRWRVTQFPYTWTPKPRAGFLYSSDGRYSGNGRFESSPTVERTDSTDDDGGAALVLNPAIEATAQPRSYTVEATVTGADDQTVTNTKKVIALPPFVLGLKTPRYIEQATRIEPEIIVAGPDGELQAGMPVTVRLLNRQWHSHLRAGDFSDGVARYITDVVDEKVSETTVTSGTAPVSVALPIAAAGVYIVELEAHDKLGRTQVVAVDLYAGGAAPVSWAKPTTRVFEVATDKDAYDPGETAVVVLKSPYQEGRVLSIVEAPDGNHYEWLDVKGGSATYKVLLKNTDVPRLPVHFILMRPRVPGTGSTPIDQVDLGKPSTIAATAWLKVNPVDNRVNVALAAPEKARPGDKIDVTIRLSDPHGRPLPGEVTLWLVDQAVLALGKEQRLDPLPDFITAVRSHLTVRDTRNLPFGYLPFAEQPGGSGGEGEAAKPFANVTVRRTFKPVPYYNPSIHVGPTGVATVSVQLADDLTVFMLRAKAISGPDRFGYVTGELAVRLPVIVQPALPRFVRPNDRFTGAAIGRIVEGAGGPGSAGISVEGAQLVGAPTRRLSWAPERPERIEFGVEVGQPAYTPEGALAHDTATFKVAVKRESDGVGDAFEVKLPIRDDRQPVTERVVEDVLPGAALTIPPLAEAARPGTVRRSVLVSAQPALIRMAAGLDFLLHYPFGCTEQRLSRARAAVALKALRGLLHEDGAAAEQPVRDFLQWLPQVVDANGLCAYWPGSQGYVSLTAWVVEFLVEARAQGYAVDQKLFDTLTTALEQSLRSDYGHFVDGEAFAERAWALSALAAAGKFNPAYAAELARRAQFLDTEGIAQVVTALVRGGDVGSSTLEELTERMWDGVVIRLDQGRQRYGGLQPDRRARNGLILPSETRTVAEVVRAAAQVKSNTARVQVLIDALVTLGRGDGWGSTNADAAALLALAQALQPPFAGTMPRRVQVRIGADEQTLTLGPDSAVARLVSADAGAGSVRLAAGAGGAVAVQVDSTYVPAADGSQVVPRANGFVVRRDLLRVPAAADAPLQRVALDTPGTVVQCAAGEIVEEHVQVVNPEERHYVAVTVPLAAGMEPLNPQLATASAAAKPRGALTRPPSYVAYVDDRVSFFYDTLPKGTYDFYFRSRAGTAGHFVQPAARAEMMYDGSVWGTSAGARIEVQ